MYPKSLYPFFNPKSSEEYELVKWIVKHSDFKLLVDSPLDLGIKLMFRLLYVTGCRTGELVSLKVEDVDLANKSIRLLDSKKKEYFVIPIDSETCSMITEYIRGLKSTWLFPSPVNEGHCGVDYVADLVKRYACKLHLKDCDRWQPRWFRRRFARNWMLKKGSMIGLQNVLRHSKISSTSIYIDSIQFIEEFENVRKEYNEIIGD